MSWDIVAGQPSGWATETALILWNGKMHDGNPADNFKYICQYEDKEVIRVYHKLACNLQKNIQSCKTSNQFHMIDGAIYSTVCALVASH